MLGLRVLAGRGPDLGERLPVLLGQYGGCGE